MAKNDYQFGQAQMTQKNAGPGGGGRMRVHEKPKDFKGAMKALLAYLGAFKLQIGIAMSCAVMGVLFQLFGPNNVSKITNVIEDGMAAGNIDLNLVLKLSLITLGFYFGSSLLSWLQSFTLVHASQNLMRKMRNDISHKMNRIPLSRFDSSSFGDVLSRVTNDVDTIGSSVNNSAAELVTAAATFVGCLFMMLKTNVPLTSIALISAYLGYRVMFFIIKKSQPYFSAHQRILGTLNGHIEEMYAGHLIVQAYNGQEECKAEFERLNEQLCETNWKSQFISSINKPVMDLLGNLGYVAVCVCGAIMAKNGTIRFGVIIAFILYVKMFTQPMSMVSQSVTSLQSAAAACERVFAFLGEKEMADESHKTESIALDACRGDVSFEHVSFGYTPQKTIIHDFSVDVKAGQKVAIVGPTGAGKTTLVNLLMRFYEIGSGKITIDGVDISQITRENVHGLFCMVLQDTWLFEGTIKDNIKYSKQQASDEDVIKACKAVGLHSFIMSLPEGYDTVLSDESNLSAGQRQLVTIARAMVEDAPLLILDEATSSVDTRTEQMVQNAMDQLTQGRTSFTIAHRLSTIRNADMILVMKDGDILETGTHDQLLAKGGFYCDLWTSQFVNAETI